MTDDLVERLQPRWATDEEISRAAAKRDNGMREIVTDFLVTTNALKAEAAARINSDADTIASLRRERDEAVSSATAARQNFHTVQNAANDLRKELETARERIKEVDLNYQLAHRRASDNLHLAIDADEARKAAEAQVAKLTEALQPFAAVGEVIDTTFGDALFPDASTAFTSVDAQGQYGCRWVVDGERKELTWGNFRRARTALQKDKT